MSSRYAETDSKALPRFFAVCLAILLMAAACATTPPAHPPAKSQGTFILLPDEQGKTGAIVVSSMGEERLLTKPGETVTVSTGAPPGKPYTISEKEVDAQVGLALTALPKSPGQFLFYFKYDSGELVEESLAMVQVAIRAIRERAPVEISVVGHTDTVGDKGYNYQLSLKRARAVAGLLISEGVDPSILIITSHGKDNPLVATGDQVPEPRNRRVELTVR
jgi:outer membrane protein OmpA-like peptidoglycan-associated protein